MPRFRPPPPRSFLGGRELRRLITMLGMLAILWMMFTRASDPKMWKFFARVPESKPAAAADQEDKTNREGEAPAEPGPEKHLATGGSAGASPSQAQPSEAPSSGAQPSPVQAATKKPDVLAWETVTPEPGVEGPLDQDPEERDGAKEQFQAISDFEPLAAVDMPAYWRLMRWSQSESFGEMKKRAQRGGIDVLFTHFAQEPSKHRGELIELKLHVVRTATFEAGENSAGVKRVYEAWGPTDNDSRSNPYLVVFSQKPPELPMGADISEEAEFVGYFLKDMSYEAYNVRRWAPLLIGRLRWRENEARSMLAAQREEASWIWPVLGIGTVALVAMIGSWIWRYRHPKKRAPVASGPTGEHSVEQWIEKAEQGEFADSSPDSGETEPGHRAVAGALDWIDPNRHNETS